MTTISDRIIQKMKETGVRQADIVKATGATKGAVSKWVAGVNIPKAEFLQDLAILLQTSQNWLLTGNSEKNIKSDLSALTEVQPIIVNQETDKDFIWIDVVEANFSCGIGEPIEFHFDGINGKFPFTAAFFQRKHVDPKNMKIIKAKGDSMADFINDGDMVGIDISKQEIIDGQVYAIYFEGEAMIKQIFKEEGGKLTLHSFNPKYRDREVSENNGISFKVIGRQFWRAG